MFGGGDLQPPLIAAGANPCDLVGVEAVLGGVAEGDGLEELLAGGEMVVKVGHYFLLRANGGN